MAQFPTVSSTMHWRQSSGYKSCKIAYVYHRLWTGLALYRAQFLKCTFLWTSAQRQPLTTAFQQVSEKHFPGPWFWRKKRMQRTSLWQAAAMSSWRLPLPHLGRVRVKAEVRCISLLVLTAMCRQNVLLSHMKLNNVILYFFFLNSQ